MKVNVTPRDGAGNPIPGAGSWTTDCVWVAGKWRDEETLAEYPASWCKVIPSITPEPGDIVEGEHGLPFFYDPVKTYSKVVRVLARKPKGFEAMKPTTYKFLKEYGHAETQEDMQAAYERFLSAILGVPYGRVDK